MVSYLLQALLQACCGVCLLAGRAVLQLLPQALQAGSLQQIANGLDSLQRLNHFGLTGAGRPDPPGPRPWGVMLSSARPLGRTENVCLRGACGRGRLGLRRGRWRRRLRTRTPVRCLDALAAHRHRTNVMVTPPTHRGWWLPGPRTEQRRR